MKSAHAVIILTSSRDSFSLHELSFFDSLYDLYDRFAPCCSKNVVKLLTWKL